MTKKCPECGDMVPDQAHFCPNCGYDFFRDIEIKPSNQSGDGLFSNGKIFLVLIVIVLVVGAGVMLTMGHGNDKSPAQSGDNEVAMTITEVSGYSFNDSDNKTLYSLSTQALFTNVPSNLEGYIIKTTYYDSNGTKIGQEIDSLSNVYSKEYSDYASSFAFFDSYKKPDPDHITVEIDKNDKKINNYTYEIDKSDIDFLN